MVSPQPQDTSLLQPTYSLPPPPPALDPREPAPPPITSPGGHIHISRNRSTGTPRTPCTPTRSPALSPASSRAASPVPGPDGRRRRERGSFGANVHPVHGSHMAVGSGLNSRSSSRGTSPIRDSVPLSHRNSGGSGLHAGMTVMTNSIDAALAAGSKGNSPPSSHLPTSPLSEQDSSPPISSVEGLAFGASDPDIAKAQSRATSGTLSPREKPVARTGSRPIQPHADAAHLGPHLHSGLSGTQTHQTAAIPAGSFLRPVSPALSATASMSDSMIFERDIESPLPPPIPSNVLERRPSRKGSRASGLNGGTGTEFSASSANSLTHSQTHSYSNLHQHYTHGDFLESKIPTVLDDAIEALTALSESERQLYTGGFTGGARSRLVDIEVESPAPVSWAGVGSSASATRLPNTTSRHHVSHSGSRPVSPLRSGITSSKASNPTSPLLDAAQPRPHLSTRASSAGPMLPGAFPSGNEQSSESWRRKIQEWIGPKGLDETSSPVSPENKGGDHEDHIDSHSGETENLQPTAERTQRLPHPHSTHPLASERHRISFVSYNDILTSHPLRVDPLSDITSGASGEPDHLPGTVSPALGLLSSSKVLVPGPDGKVSRSVSLNRGTGSSPVATDTPDAAALPTSIQDRLGISAHVTSVLPAERLKGNWEREGLGKGLQERLEELAINNSGD